MARGWCFKHWKRWRKWGDPTKKREPNTIESLLARYEVAPDGCWNWTGGLTPQGCAKSTLGNRTVGVARLAYEQAKGAIPEGYFVCHTCDNPRCINPDHLFVGTPLDNVQDMDRKGRRSYARRSLTPEQVAYVRSSTKRQTALAAELGVAQQVISNILTGKTYRNV